MNEFISGMKYVLTGIRLLIRPGIRLYVIIPMLVNAVIFAGIIIFGASQISALIDFLTTQWTWLDWFSWLLWPLFVIISLGMVFFLFTPLANLIAAPFNGFLAEAVERHLEGKTSISTNTDASIITEVISALKSESIKFSYFFIRAIPLLLLFLIPFVQAVAPLIWFLFGAWILSLEYLEIPMGNHKKLFPEVRSILKENRAVSMGFGMASLGLTSVPVINFIAMPAAVCGATSLWHDKIKHDIKQLSVEENNI